MNDEQAASSTGQGGASEEQLREYLDQLRSAPVDQVVTDLLSSALTAAQAKLGRNDARLMIDVSGLIFDHARTHLPDETRQQLDQVLSQLRLTQVQAESTVAQRGGEEPNDLPQPPAPPSGQPAAGEPTGQQATPQQQAATSKLWVPGR